MQHLARKLWSMNADLAVASRDCPFVRGLADGSLPSPNFQEYVKQDAYFLEAFARAYALAMAAVPDREGLHAFAGLLSGVLEELRLHSAYATRWHVDLRIMQPSAATLAYTGFLLETARTSSTGDICAAMAPCMRLYAWLGQHMALDAVRIHPYAEWIATYASPTFESLAGQLETLLDMYADDSTRVHTLYRTALQMELVFFQANSP